MHEQDISPWKIDELQFLPPTVQDFVAEDHLARFVVSLVTEELDLVEITASYLGEKGQPPFHPAMMAALLLYAYCCGIYSSRRVAKACRERVDFMSIVALDPPDFRTICEFRKRHLKALSGLFVQVLKLCEKADLLKLGHVAFDGRSRPTPPSTRRCPTSGWKRATQLEAEVAKWFADAEAADSEEDKLHGSDKQGDEMPDWVADKKRRAEKIRAAKAELEAEAKAAAAAKAKVEAEAEEKRGAADLPGFFSTLGLSLFPPLVAPGHGGHALKSLDRLPRHPCQHRLILACTGRSRQLIIKASFCRTLAAGARLDNNSVHGNDMDANQPRRADWRKRCENANRRKHNHKHLLALSLTAFDPQATFCAGGT
jgi:transposase